MKNIIKLLLATLALAGAITASAASATNSPATLEVCWAASPTPNVTYNLFTDNVSRTNTLNYGSVTNVGTNLCMATTNILVGTNYYFNLTAVDTNGVQSVPAGEIHFQLTQPLPPGTTTVTVTIP